MHSLCRSAGALFLLVLTSLFFTDSLAAQTPQQTALQVDQLLAEETGSAPAASASDEVFLRRAFLDLVGQLPTSEEVLAFSLDPGTGKRVRLVQQLLDDDDFGRNWGRYWRDVIMYRRTDDRASLAQGSLESFLVEQLNNDTSWSSIARQLITAAGDVREDGRNGLIMAQGGRPEETVAEVSRIFLGIQIQCAQCHDHPFDRWTREQFHQLAAFFPRVAVRPQMTPVRSFIVVASDTPPRQRRQNNNNRFVGSLEHYMPDLDDPTAQGTLMQPEFFATGQTLQTGSSDAARRESLADWMTDPENPWFARALVNRVWSELVGEGFYEPVDDIGPDRQCSAAKTMALLCDQLVVNDYDLKWLIETILSTRVYQSAAADRRAPDELPFQANYAQRLRADQLFNSLLCVFDIPDPTPQRAAANYGRASRSTPRALFQRTFGYDPSTRRDEVGGSIPQALAMMNSSFVNQQISARPGRLLGDLMAEVRSDRQLVEELYIKVLSRQPSREELKLCLDYRRSVPDRAEAFEDILWALINHADFIYRN